MLKTMTQHRERRNNEAARPGNSGAVETIDQQKIPSEARGDLGERSIDADSTSQLHSDGFGFHDRIWIGNRREFGDELSAVLVQ
jgi:hypothetical protein